MTSGGREIEVGGGSNCQNNVQDHPFECSTEFWAPDLSVIETTHLDRQETHFQVCTYIFEYRPLPPYVHLMSTHVMNAPRPSLFFTDLLPCIIVNTDEGKNGGGLGMRLTFTQNVILRGGILVDSYKFFQP